MQKLGLFWCLNSLQLIFLEQDVNFFGGGWYRFPCTSNTNHALQTRECLKAVLKHMHTHAHTHSCKVCRDQSLQHKHIQPTITYFLPLQTRPQPVQLDHTPTAFLLMSKARKCGNWQLAQHSSQLNNMRQWSISPVPRGTGLMSPLAPEETTGWLNLVQK